jgi:hypothetical protein
LQPAIGDGVFAAEREEVIGKADRHAGGGRMIIVGPIQLVGTLAGADRGGAIVEPEGRHAEALQPFRRLLDAERMLERGPRLFPGAAPKRLLASDQRILCRPLH